MLGQILTKANQVYAIPTHVARSFLKPVAADSLSDQIFGAAPVACKDRHFLAPAPFVDLEQSLGRHDCDERRARSPRSEEHTSELQSRFDLVCRLLLANKK